MSCRGSRSSATRLKVIIDDRRRRTAKPNSGETQAAKRLASLGRQGERQAPAHGKLQHNKTIVVDGPKVQAVVCGSTNFTLARVLRAGQQRDRAARQERGQAVPRGVRRLLGERRRGRFGKTAVRELDRASGSTGIDAQVAFSPHSRPRTRCSTTIADDIARTPRRACSTRSRSCSRRPGSSGTRSRRSRTTTSSSSTASPTGRSAASIVQKPDGNVAPVRPGGAEEERSRAVQDGADRRRRQPHAPQVRRHRLRQADGPGLPRLLQLLARRRT